MRKTIFIALAAVAVALSTSRAYQYFEHPTGANDVWALSYGTAPVELLSDVNFADGFRAFWTAESFEKGVDASLKLGTIQSNYTPYVNSLYPGWNYVSHAWGPLPSGDVWIMPVDKRRSWQLNEGLHEDFYDEANQYYPPAYDAQGNRMWNPATDLAVHRMEVNAECTGCDSSNPSFLLLNSFNQYPTHGWTHDLVRTAYSNRNGGLYTYMDTSKEIRNVAVDNTNGLDTWPHYYVEQNFKQLIDLATLDTVTLKAKFRVWNVPSLNPVPGGAFANAVYGVGFTLRRKQNPYQVVFLGYHLYAKQANSPQTWGYDASFDADQFGQVFFNGDTLTDLGSLVPDDSNPIFSGGTFKEIELRQLFNKAKVAGANRPPFADPRQEMNRQDFLSTVFEDYYLAAVGVGWETMGWEEVRSQITEVSLQGQTLPFFDADVFEADYYSAQFDWAGQGRFGIQRTHWLQYGINDGWHGSATFWPDVYRTRYASEIAAVYGSATNRNAILHYIAIGRAQGKSGAP